MNADGPTTFSADDEVTDPPVNARKSLLRHTSRMTRRVIGLVIALPSLLLIVVGPGSLFELLVEPPNKPPFRDVSAFTNEDKSLIDAWLREQLEICGYPSLSVTIVRDEKTVYLGTFGFENIKAKRKATPNTLFHVASVTKAFTATLAAILHEHGVVDIDAPVTRYLPDDVVISRTPEAGAKITLRQLASHTSGLPRDVWGRVQTAEGCYHLEPQRLYQHLSNIKLTCEPGSCELYSNLGFGLLGHVLERAADTPFDRLFEELIGQPLELNAAIEVDHQLPHATGYTRVPVLVEWQHSFKRRLAASGGLVASAADLAEFLKAQLKPGLLSNEMLDLLHEEAVSSDGHRSRNALGWSVRSSDYAGRILTKNGGRRNCSAWIGFAPEHGVGVAVVTNCGLPSVDPIGYWLLERSVSGGMQPATRYGYAKVAPFTGVRWSDDRPIVCVQGRWSPLISIDGIPVERIMEFARGEFDDLARKRFSEDLVETLAKMGHPPDWNVTLGLETTEGDTVHKNVLMTERMRKSVRNGSTSNAVD